MAHFDGDHQKVIDFLQTHHLPHIEEDEETDVVTGTIPFPEVDEHMLASYVGANTSRPSIMRRVGAKYRSTCSAVPGSRCSNSKSRSCAGSKPTAEQTNSCDSPSRSRCHVGWIIGRPPPPGRGTNCPDVNHTFQPSKRFLVSCVGTNFACTCVGSMSGKFGSGRV